MLYGPVPIYRTAVINDVAALIADLLTRVAGGIWSPETGAAAGGVTLTIPLGQAQVVLVGSGVTLEQASAASQALEGARPLLEALLESRRRLAEAEDRATTDHLTGLLNRWGWDLALAAEEARCQRHERQAVVAVVDLDDLKKFNDAQGHLGGDMLLRLTADALRTACRVEDSLARIGGDEFGLLAVDVRPGDEAKVVARLRQVLDGAGIAASVGAAERSSDGGLSAALDLADHRMYLDKARRKTEG